VFEASQAQHFAVEQAIVAARRFGRLMSKFGVLAGHDGPATLGAMAVMLLAGTFAPASRPLERGDLNIIGKRHTYLEESDIEHLPIL
jgi:hypothetical protein